MTKPHLPSNFPPSAVVAVEKARRSRKRLAMSERGLGVAGLALAVVSGAFASYMISVAQRPGVNGAEYFGVFAKLTPGGRKPGDGKPLAGADSDPDPLATGSVRPAGDSADADPPAAAPVDPRTMPAPGAAPLKGYGLRYVFQGRALIQTPAGLVEVRPGTFLPNIGFVTAIEQRGGKWVVVTSLGVIGESPG